MKTVEGEARRLLIPREGRGLPAPRLAARSREVADKGDLWKVRTALFAMREVIRARVIQRHVQKRNTATFAYCYPLLMCVCCCVITNTQRIRTQVSSTR